MPNKPAPLTAEEILTETRRMIDSKRWRSTATALNAYREFIDMAMPRMMDIVEQQREQIEALKNRLVGTEAENGLLDTRHENLQTDMEVLKKERDSLQAELQKWMERFGPAAEASCPR